MAPVLDQAASLLQTRVICSDGQYYYNGSCRYGDTWYWYGRWIFAAVLIGLVLIIFFAWACINSRRRRRRGINPMYGTGWMAPNNGNQYYNNPQAYRQPPPAYGAPPDQSYPMTNQYQTTDGHYNQQSTGVEPPKHVYGGDYAPPAGPPPGR
ncbi:chitin synthesis regulation, resistance to congo red-domain-containing protein [Xylariaceae sp. FL1651]|nr:chitin synthesis regulation, resistance to congo red-domain-containing protein [Xylariaceae sp. FL1651]